MVFLWVCLLFSPEQATYWCHATVTTSFEIPNPSQEVWLPGEYFYSYHLFSLSGDKIIQEGKRTPLLSPHPPGEIRKVTLTWHTPGKPGTYLLKVDVVREGHDWFSQKGSYPFPTLSFKTILPQVTFHASLPRFSFGRRAEKIPVTIINKGSHPIPSKARLSYHLYNWKGKVIAWDGPRVDFPEPLKPGQKMTLKIPWHVNHTGVFQVAWDLVEEHSLWYSQANPKMLQKHWIFNLSLPTLFRWLYVGFLLTLMIRRKVEALPLGGMVFFKLLLAQCWLDLPFTWVSLGSFAGFTLLVVGVHQGISPKGKKLFTPSLLFILGLIAIGDLLYLTFFKDFPSVMQVTAIHQVPQIHQSIKELLQWKLLLLLIDALFLLILLFFSPGKKKPSQGVSLMVLGGWMVPLILSISYFTHPLQFHKRFRNVFLAQKVGWLNFHLYDVTHTLHQIFFPTSPPEGVGKRLPSLWASREKLIQQPSPWKGMFKGFNVIAIQEESLQAFPLYRKIDGKAVMPFLDKLTREGLYFPWFFDQTDQGRTSDAEFAVLNSLHPVFGGSVNFLYATHTFHTLLHHAKQAGYHTAYFHPYDGAFWNREVMLPRYGFDKCFFKPTYEPTDRLGWGISNISFYQQTLQKIQSLPQPFFAYLVTLTGHHPYKEAEKLPQYRHLFPSLPKTLRNYLLVCRYKDDALRIFFHALRKSHLWDKTLVVYFGDHDAGLWNESYDQALGMESGKPLARIYQDRLPLLFYSPKLPKGKKIKTPTGHIDIAPILIHLLGLPPTPWTGVGKNPFVSSPLGAVTPKGVVIGKDYIYDAQKDGCFDRKNFREVPLSSCQTLKDQLLEEQESSRWIVQGDLLKTNFP